MTIVQNLWCCWRRRPNEFASKPFRESDFKYNEKDKRRSISLHGPGVEGFLEDISPSPTSLGQCLIDVFGKHHDCVAQINAGTGEALKYKDILAEALALAAGLRALGVTPGKLIGLLASPNDAKVNIILVTSFILGAVLYPLDPSEKTFEKDIVTLLDKQPKLLLSVDEGIRHIANMSISEKPMIVSIGGKTGQKDNDRSGVSCYEDILKGEEGIVDLTELNPQDVLVMLPNHNRTGDEVLSNEMLIKYTTRKNHTMYKFSNTMLLDYETSFGVSWIVRRVFLFRYGGQTVTITPPYDPETTLALIQKHRITWLALTSAQLLELCHCQAIMGYDLSSFNLLNASTDEHENHVLDGATLISIRERLPATRIIVTGKTISDAIPV